MIARIKKSKSLSIILILIILLGILLITRITYAYLEKEKSIPGVTEGIITASGDRLIFTKGSDLALNISTDNFNSTTEGNIIASTYSQVTLIANAKTNDAQATYSIGINIIKNSFVSSDNNAELVLQVKCDGVEVEKIDNLNPITIKGVTGFDITNKVGTFNVAIDKEITSKDSIKGTTHNWEYTVILINKENDQSINETAKFKAEIYMKEKILVLADVCKNQELAKCLKDNYALDSSLYHHDGQADNPSEQNANLEASDDSYRYSGASANVNNYVCLDARTSEEQCDDDDLFRIIGFFKNAEGKYEAKLIKARLAKEAELGDANFRIDGDNNTPSANKSNSNFYWNSTNGINEIDNTNVNMWKESNLNKVNLNNFYYNFITNKVIDLANNIISHNWQVGGSTNQGYAKEIYDSELGDNKLTNTSNYCYVQGNKNARQCNENNDLTYGDYIGLMYLSDYMYGTLPEYWLTTMDQFNLSEVKTNNWLAIDQYEWTITRYALENDRSMSIVSEGYAKDSSIYGYSGVRPCFYLSSNTKLASGKGTYDKPYRLTFN